MKIMQANFLGHFMVSLALLVACALPVSKAAAQHQEQASTYLSQIDDDLTIRRVSVLPVVDNVEGIYARPIEAQLTQLVKGSHRWDFVEANITGGIPTLIELEENQAEVQRLVRPIEADAFIAAAAVKGPNGLSIRVDLLLKKDGKVLSQESLRDHPRYELAEIKDRVTDLYRKLIARVPYDGILLSRQQNRVTVNLGKSDGIKKEQIITAVQIISVNRHPKFNFLVSTEKEILGRIKILKVDESLSFGAIISEKERGAIRRFAKVGGLEQVNYGEPARLEEGSAAGEVGARPDSAVTFGKDPKEWLPVRPPAFGQIAMKVGMGTFNDSVSIVGGDSYEAKSSLAPSIGLSGELWLSPLWTIHAELAQGMANTDNPRSGSQPSNLNHNMSRYSMEADYNFLLRDDFFGPKITLGAGLSYYHMYVDSSTPLAFTTVNYTGMLFSLGSLFPVTDDKQWYAGGRLRLYLMPKLSEDGASSGASSTSNVTDFGVTAQKRIAENIRAFGELEFSLYSSNISGQGTRSGASGAESASTISQRHTDINVGIIYMF